jgi:pimeloyl-ACP methyl ester carboxylesterase
MQMEGKSICIDNLRIVFDDFGNGEAILILHGWGGSRKSWINVVDYLVKDGYRVIVPDLPGFGESEDPKNPQTVNNYRDFVLKFTEKMNLSSLYLVGHSFGGRIAAKIASQNSQIVKKMVLCDASGIKMELDSKAKMISSLSRLGNIIFSKRLFSEFRKIAKNIFHFFLRRSDYVKARGVMRETLKLVVQDDISSELSEIKTKTLIIWGQKDNMVPLKVANIFKEKIINSELKVFPGIKHNPHREIPKELSKTIDDFFKQE